MKNKKLIPVCVVAGALSMCLLCSCDQKAVQTNGEPESKTSSTTSVTTSENSGSQTTPESSTTSATAPASTTSTTQKPMDTRGEAMLGTWRDSVSQRAMMTVKRTDDGFSVVIHWANSATDYNEWRMTGAFENVENGRIVSTDCAMYEVSTDENGKATEKTIYIGGKAHITYVKICCIGLMQKKMPVRIACSLKNKTEDL